MLMAFDLVELDGVDQRKRPLRERRQALEHLLRDERLILPVRRLSSSGLEAWKEVVRAGYEGLVGKDPESRRPLGRGRSHRGGGQREGSAPGTTFRLMRACVVLGLLTADTTGRFHGTPLLETLRKGAPGSLRGLALATTLPG
jgi:ATP dependent DNA ligase-like protein